MIRTLFLVAVAGFYLNANAQQLQTTTKQALQVQQPIIQPSDYDKHYVAGNEIRPITRIGEGPTTAERSSSAVGTKIGETTYDLQTNGSTCRRVMIDNDGLVHTMWTQSFTYNIDASDRGTGYNVWDGTEWGGLPSERVEPDDLRTGWPNIGMTSTGRIFSISHTSTQGMNFCYKDPGGVWTNKLVGEESGTLEGIWARAGVDGENIHAVIVGITDSDLAYFRSTDGGDTWDGPSELPNIRDYYSLVYGDRYFLDVNGASVAIFIGGYASQVVMYRSDDNGDSWTPVVIQATSNPLIPTFQAPDGSALEPVAVSSGSLSGLIDDNGIAHLAFDRCFNFRSADTAPGGGGPYYLPNSSCIMYWNENMEEPMVVGETIRQDNNQDGTTSATGYERQSYSSLVDQPSIGVDEDNNIYVAYSTTQDGHIETAATATVEGRLYRDIHIVKTTDGGASWDGPLSVTDSDNEEDVFPSIARDVVDDTVHLIYQSDELTGMAAIGPGHDEFVMNDIMYVAIDVNDIVDPEPLGNTYPEFHFSPIPSFVLEACEMDKDQFGVHCLDYPDGEISDIVFGGTVDITTPNPTGEGYNWELSSTDTDGNTRIDDLSAAFNPIPNIPVYADVAPEIYGAPVEFISNADGSITVESLFESLDTVDVIQGTEYVDLGFEILRYVYTGTDTVFIADTGCPPILSINNPVNTEVIGEYLVAYSVETHTGLQAETLTRVVNVIAEDVTPPVIAISGNDGTVLETGDVVVLPVQSAGEWNGLDFWAYDNVDGVITEMILIAGNVDLTNIGEYNISYSVMDSAGNATEITITISVIDMEPPQISISPTTSVISTCGEELSVNITAFDNVDGNISDQLTYTVENNDGVLLDDFCLDVADIYLVHYQVTDANGNVGEGLHTIVVECDEGTTCPLVTTSIKETLVNVISIYPNPTRANILVDLGTTAKATVDVYNTAGQLVTTTTNDGNSSVTLKLANQIPGVYFVQVTTAKGATAKKVVLEK